MARPKLEDNVDVLNRSERPKRQPVNGFKDRLKVEGQEPGWHYCWVNDYEVDRFMAGDYQHVTHPVIVGHKRIDVGSGAGAHVSIPVGNGVVGYLMRIPMELHLEDEQSNNSEVDSRESSMYEELNAKKEGRYGKVEIQHGGRVNSRR